MTGSVSQRANLIAAEDMEEASCNPSLSIMKPGWTLAPQRTPQAMTHRGAVVEVHDGRDEVVLCDGVEGGVQEIGRGAGAVDLRTVRCRWVRWTRAAACLH